jgi:two-component system CheB/CheR fusion protein
MVSRTAKRCFAVEDNPDVRRLTLRRLNILGYRTLATGTGPAALAVLESGEDVDLIFSDIVMPGGLSACLSA